MHVLHDSVAYMSKYSNLKCLGSELFSYSPFKENLKEANLVLLIELLEKPSA